jgi:hypothetical protein
MRILVSCCSGLNDQFKSLANCIKFVSKHFTKDLSCIKFASYYDLEKYFDFKHIEYKPLHPDDVYRQEISTYNIVFGLRGFSDPEDFIPMAHVGEYLSNFISLKENIKKSFKCYPDHIGLSFRFYDKEKNEMDYEKDLYISEFLNIYNQNENYLIVSDDNCFVDDLKHLKNVSFIVPDEFINKKTEPVSIDICEARNKHSYLAIYSAYALSTCKLIYRTAGGFPYVARLFNKDVEIKNLLSTCPHKRN